MSAPVFNLNGKILPAEKAVVPVLDRSYLYGDSLYEVARTYDGVLTHLKPHLDRMAVSAELCRMKLGQSIEEYGREMVRTVEAFHALPGMKDREAYCRIVVSRGVGRIGFSEKMLQTPTQYAIIVQPLEPPTAVAWEKGQHLRIAERVRNAPNALDPAMKSGNYLNSLLAYLEETAKGAEDALMVDAQGFLTEGTTFNLFYVNDGIVCTSPLDVGILDGITRRNVIEAGRAGGIPFRITRYTPERLFEADEVFVSSTIKEVLPVTRLDGRTINDGKPGPVARRLLELFRACIPAWVEEDRRWQKSLMGGRSGGA